jgi:serine/threonine protein kinase
MSATPYTIIGKIGEGGMGTVFLAEDTALERRVAIKELNKSALTSGDMTENRFQQEALALARLNHPNITHLYAFLPQRNTWWMVMEYVEGKTLEEWLTIHKKLSPSLACSIVLQILDGLRHAHKKGIIHRDLKPANIMISADGEVKVMDFGIARIRQSQRITRHGKSVGTLAYMAPEQIQGQEGDERTDIYAIGSILYELICGQTPFAGDTDYHLMKAKLEQQPPSINKFSHTTPPSLQKAILKTLEKNPTKRFDSVESLKEVLEKSTLNIASQQQLIHQLSKPQVAEEAPAAGKLFSPAQPLSKATNVVKQKVKELVPTFGSLPKKPSNPILLLLASILICMALLIWNNSRQNSVETDENNLAEMKQTDTTAGAISEGLIQSELQQYTQPISDQKPTPRKDVPLEEQDETPQKEKVIFPKKEKENPSKKTPITIKEPTDEPPVNEKPPTVDPLPAKTGNAGPIDIPAGRSITLTLNETLSSENKERDGEKVNLVASENVEINGRTIIRSGAHAEGKIVDVIPSSGRKKALIGFIITHIEAVDGTMLKLASERFRNMASSPGITVYYQKGQQFTAALKRARLQ